MVWDGIFDRLYLSFLILKLLLYYYHRWIIYQTSYIRMNFDCFHIISYHIMDVECWRRMSSSLLTLHFCLYSLSTIDHHIWNVPMFNVRCTKSIYPNVDISEMWKHHLQFHPHQCVPFFSLFMLCQFHSYCA